MIFRDGRRIDHKRRLRIAARLRNSVYIVGIMNVSTFAYKFFCQGRFRAVVAADKERLREEIALQGAHSYAACTYEID